MYGDWLPPVAVAGQIDGDKADDGHCRLIPRTHGAQPAEMVPTAVLHLSLIHI